jgi:hypothetical protein
VALTLADKVASFAADEPDWQIADALNAPDATANGTKTVDAAISDARAILMTSGAWGGICLTAEDTTKPAQVRALCVTVRDAHQYLTSFKMTDPKTAAAVTGMVDSLLAATLIDQATHDALLALGTVPASWADLNNNGQPVDARAVGLARGAKA